MAGVLHLSRGGHTRTKPGECQCDEGMEENLDAAHWVGAVQRGAEGSYMQLHLLDTDRFRRFLASNAANWCLLRQPGPAKLSFEAENKGQPVLVACADIGHVLGQFADQEPAESPLRQ